MAEKRPSRPAGIGMIPRSAVLGVGIAVWLGAYFSQLPRWAATLAAVVVGLVWMADYQLRALATLSPAKQRERKRNVAIALALAALVGLFYLGAIVRLGPNVFNRPY
jgi:hypothetical protein